jgi:adenosylhomocysteine nucleosidase
MRLGFITALPGEARTLDDVVAGGAHLLDICGIGPANAGAGAQRLMVRGVDGLVSWGTAGALDTDYVPGTIIVLEAVVNDAGTCYRSDVHWHRAMLGSLAPLNAVAARGYSASHAAASTAEKASIRARTGCAAVDMESVAVAAVAQTAGIPFIALRVVVDPADFQIPQCALNGLRDDGRTHAAALIKALARRPHELPDLLQLARWYRYALTRLRRAAKVLRPAFGAPGGDEVRAHSTHDCSA